MKIFHRKVVHAAWKMHHCWCSSAMLIFAIEHPLHLIPTIVVPVALLGTFAVMELASHDINILAMFAMVLVIGNRGGRCINGGGNVERSVMASLPKGNHHQEPAGQIQGIRGRHHRDSGDGVPALCMYSQHDRQHLSPVLAGGGHLAIFFSGLLR